MLIYKYLSLPVNISLCCLSVWYSFPYARFYAHLVTLPFSARRGLGAYATHERLPSLSPAPWFKTPVVLPDFYASARVFRDTVLQYKGILSFVRSFSLERLGFLFFP